MTYYDIDDILSEDEKVNVKFNEICVGIGFLDQHQEFSDGKDIPKGTVLEMPFWLGVQLAQTISVSKQSNFEEDTPIAVLEIPKIYRSQFQNSLLADPTVINLREKSNYFYEFGLKMAEYLEDPKLIDILICVFLKRAKQFAKLSFSLIIQQCDDMILRMTHSELNIFNSGRKISMELRQQKFDETQNSHYNQIFTKLKRIKAN
ncbi:hypothetical protein ABPG72_020593 [Tetrahymena utriculariae]